MAYRTEAVIHIEISLPNYRTTHYNEETNYQNLCSNHDLIAKVKEDAKIRMEVYKQRVARFFNNGVKVRNFNKGDWVFLKANIRCRDIGTGKLEEN